MKDAHQPVGVDRQEPHEGFGQSGKEEHGRRTQLGHGVGQVYSHAFGEEFAQLALQVGGGNQDERFGSNRGRFGRQSNTDEPLGEIVAHLSSRVDTGEDAHNGDANLCRRQEFVGIVNQVKRHLGRAASFLHGHLKAALAGRDQGYLREGEEGIEEDQNADYDKVSHLSDCVGWV